MIDLGVRFIGAEMVTIGDRVTIWRDSEFQGPISIGSGTFINCHVCIRPNTRIGTNVSVGQFARFISDTHETTIVDRRTGKTRYEAITIGDGAWIGACALVLGGVRVGEGSIVGAGSVVTRDVEPNMVYAGNPARPIRELERLRRTE